jgi:hypothetical protein
MTATPALVRTPFGFDSTAADGIAGVDISGKRAIVTGSLSGMEPKPRGRSDPRVLAAIRKSAGYEYKTPAQGAATSVLAAASPLLDGVSGGYFADCNEAPVVGKDFTSSPRGFGVAPYALDRDNATRLWDMSQQLVERYAPATRHRRIP